MSQDLGHGNHSKECVKKQPKRGIIYLSTIPPYMNVSQIREYFGQYGKVGRVYLQLHNQGKSFSNRLLLFDFIIFFLHKRFR